LETRLNLRDEGIVVDQETAKALDEAQQRQQEEAIEAERAAQAAQAEMAMQAAQAPPGMAPEGGVQ
jgi:hypothetical protein